MTLPTIAALRAKPYLLSITAEYFLSFLEHLIATGERHLSISDCEVTGAVDFVGRSFPNGLCMERVYFRDAVQLNNCKFLDKVYIRTCAFDRPLEAGNASFENGLTFESCTFGLESEKLARIILNLSNAEIAGHVVFFDSKVHGCVSAQRLALAGDIEFSACTLEGDSGNGAPVLDLSNSNIVGNVLFESNDARNFRTGVESVKAATQTNVPPIVRSIFMDKSRVVSVRLRNSRAANVLLSYARFGGEVDLTFLQCRAVYSRAWYFACRADEAVQWTADGTAFGGAQIEGNLLLSGGKLSYVHLDGISVSGSLMLIDGESGQIRVEDAISSLDTEWHIVPSELGNFIMSAWHCRDFLSLHVSRINGSNNEWGSRGVHIYSTRIDRSLSFWPGAEITRTFQTYLDGPESNDPGPQCLIANNERRLENTKDNDQLRNQLNRWDRGLQVGGSINIQRCTIGGDIILTGVTVSDQRPGNHGRIDILHSSVTGEVTFGSPISYLMGPHRKDQILSLSACYFLAKEALSQIGGSAGTSAIQRLSATSSISAATCDGVDMHGMVASNVELSGLRIRPPANQRDIGMARVNLHYAKIGGKLATLARTNAEALTGVLDEIMKIIPTQAASASELPRNALLPERVNRRKEMLSLFFGDGAIDPIHELQKRTIGPARISASAMIPGALDLQHSRIDELIVSDESFRELSRSDKAAESGIVLDYACINKLYVARSESTTGVHNGFPVPLSLLDLKVQSWFLETTDHTTASEAFITHECTESSPYLDLLDNDRVFRMSTYLAVEQSLRNRGMEEEANDIFVAGRYRDFRTDSQSEPGEPRQTGMKHLWRDWTWRIWRAGDGRPRRSMLIPVLRLSRPRREYLGFALCVLWIVAAVDVGVRFVQHPLHGENLPGVILLLTIFVLLSNAMRCFLDQLYWSLLDYGTSAARLALVILFLASLSLVFVSGERRNFMPTLQASSFDAQRQLAVTPLPNYLNERKWDGGGNPLRESWPFGERLWMTLRYHVPLVSAVVSDEWQPADRPLIISGVTGLLGENEAPAWWPFERWMRSRDWFGLMLWINWALWPLFLPFFIRKLTPDRQQ